MIHPNPQNALLSLMLKDQPGGLPVTLERIELKLGPWPHELGAPDTHVYFPEDALITLGAGSATERGADSAVIGRQGCWAPSMLKGPSMQAQVMLAGHAYRLDWTPVNNDPVRYARWLWCTTAATQSLIRQMAQMAFCNQHHNPEQRMASWLLICLSQYPQFTLHLSLEALPPSLKQPASRFHAILHKLETYLGVHRLGDVLRTVDPEQLAGLACSCHQEVTRTYPAQAFAKTSAA